jgi:probable rRNA maturation factor
MIEVEIDESAWTAALADAAGLARQAALAASGGASGEIAILLTGDEAVRRLNARFRCHDRPTNVLAFPDPSADRLGDVAVAFGVCEREAGEQAKPLADHLRHLVVHGVLHLMGYDHAGDDDAARMETMERQLLATMNVPDPYAEAARAR